MRFRILGRVEILDNDRALDVAPPQRRAVLAALVVDAGTPVTPETLVDRVWGSTPPDAARTALYAHIARLRQVLTQLDAAPITLHRRSGGYLLDIDQDQVDMYRFQRLVQKTRRSPEDDPERVRLLSEALQIWRGPPLSGVPGAWADGVRHRMEPQLVSAAVAWAQAQLRLGNVDQVIHELSQLVNTYPLAEPLVAMLMRALCVGGRSAEALRRYALIRAQLVEQLGTEPERELQRLHTAILRGDLDGPVSGPVPPPAAATIGGPSPPRPRQLRGNLTGFTGRTRELATIHELFGVAEASRSLAVVAINGRPGVGKSAVAIQAAHQLVDRFPDGQLYVDLQGAALDASPADPIEVLGRLLRALGVDRRECPHHPEEATSLLRTVVADRRLLLVLDNVLDTNQVRPLLPGAPGCGVLVTSRRAMVGLTGARHLCLGPLPEREAIALLGRTAGDARITAEPEPAAQLARWCDQLPLALHIAGARLAARPRWSIAALAERLADERRRLDELEHGELSVRGSLAASYQQLRNGDGADRLAAALLPRLAGLARSDLTSAGVAGALGESAPEVERLLERLVDAGLLESPAPGRYQLPELVRLFANSSS